MKVGDHTNIVSFPRPMGGAQDLVLDERCSRLKELQARVLDEDPGGRAARWGSGPAMRHEHALDEAIRGARDALGPRRRLNEDLYAAQCLSDIIRFGSRTLPAPESSGIMSRRRAQRHILPARTRMYPLLMRAIDALEHHLREMMLRVTAAENPAEASRAALGRSALEFSESWWSFKMTSSVRQQPPLLTVGSSFHRLLLFLKNSVHLDQRTHARVTEMFEQLYLLRKGQNQPHVLPPATLHSAPEWDAWALVDPRRVDLRYSVRPNSFSAVHCLHETFLAALERGPIDVPQESTMAEALGLFYRLLADDLRDPTILRQNSSDEVALFLRLLLSRKVRLPRKLRLAAEDLLSRVPRAFDALHGSSIARAKDILKNAESEQALLEASRLLGTVACSGPHKKAYARARVDLVRQMIPYLLQSIADRDGPAFHRQHGALYLVWISEHCADELRAILTPVAISLQQAIRRDLKAGPQGIQKLGSDIGHGLRYNPQLTGPDGERTRELVDELRCEMAKSDMLTFVASLPETFNPMERITGVHIGRQEARQAVQTYYRAMAEVRNPGRFKPSFEREYGPTPAQQRSACVLMARDMSG